MKKTVYLWMILVPIAGCKPAMDLPVALDYNFPSPVDTKNKPVLTSEPQVFNTNGGISASNNFDGARMNDFMEVNDSTYRAVILPENEPINPSPWYALKIWGSKKRDIYLQLDYVKYKHRYQPKLSSDGLSWQTLDSLAVNLNQDSTTATFMITVDPDTMLVAAQELITSSQVYLWCRELAGRESVALDTVGSSPLGRPLVQLDLGHGKSRKKPVIVIFSRQHPPEVTGFMALQAFLERITDYSGLSREFLKSYRLLVYPLMNPDGVDLGHWRHNAHGVDLNRDWAYYHQKENRTIADQVVAISFQSQSEVILGLDFHSTWYDVYYTNNMDSSSLMPNFKDRWLSGIEKAIPGYQVHERPSGIGRPVSKSWFFTQFKAVGITYEIGDNTSRDFVKLKGQVSAEEMMKILMKERP